MWLVAALPAPWMERVVALSLWDHHIGWVLGKVGVKIKDSF